MSPSPQRAAAPRLPQLRQELTLTRGAPSSEGAPTWMLHDPAANRFFQLGWPAFELISRWAMDDAATIVAAVNRETTLSVTLDDFTALVRTLRQQHLLVVSSSDDTSALRAGAAAARLSGAMWLLKHYLMIRIPLWQPMPLLRRLAPWVRVVYRPPFWWLTGAVMVAGLFMVSRQWDQFIHTFHGYADLRGLISIAIALGCAKVLHEFGHAFTAHRYGCKVPTMGVAFLVMLPVLYTDTTEAWKVTERGKRLRIGAAGMLSELTLAAFATLAWSLLPDGPLRGGAFLLATTSWIGTLTINASPFMRFDGYFLLSDWVGMPNLHDRAFAFGRWAMREWLFGLRDPQPEPCTPQRRRFLVGFAFATWIYRLVVFFSIALVVYHAFFKALGIALFFVEFGWFIVRPITREVQACWARRATLHWCRQTVRSAVLGAALLAVLVLPWHGGIDAPAVFGPQQAQGLYIPQAGYLSSETPPAHDGQHVHAGEVLAVVISPDLQYKLKQAQAQAALLKWESEQQAFDERLVQRGTALRKRADSARQNVAGLQAQIDQLTVRAPFDGIVETADDEGLAAGMWLPRGARLFDMVGAGAPEGGAAVKGDAYVGEDEIGRIKVGDAASFIASVPEIGALRCHVTGVDNVNLANLDEPYVASLYGGPVSAELQPSTHQLIPLQTVYRVRIGECTGHAVLARQIAGSAMLGGARESLAWRWIRQVSAAVQVQASS